jgi:hypothetical protein
LRLLLGWKRVGGQREGKKGNGRQEQQKSNQF